jgi:hypothetical protein
VLAAAQLAAGATIKPQPLIVGPVLAWVVVERSGWRGAARAAVAGAAVLGIGHLYFALTGHLGDLVTIYREAVVTPERLSFSAYNLWWPLAQTRGLSSADIAFRVGPVDATWGMLALVLVAGVLAVTATGLRRRRDDAEALLACAYLIFGFFMVGSGIHERYDMPALAFLLPALALAGGWALPALGLTATITANALMGLPFDRFYPQGQPGWLTVVVSAVNVVLLAWMTWLMLRARSWHGPETIPLHSQPARHQQPSSTA